MATKRASRKSSKQPASRSRSKPSVPRTRSKQASPSATGKSAGGAADGQSPRLPKPGRSAELVVRQGFVIDATGKGPLAVPELVILGNAEGLRFLAELFAELAQLARSRPRSSDGMAVHLSRGEPPINTRFSDDLEFRFAVMTSANRRAVLKQFGIDTKSKQKGSLFERYQEVVAQFGRLSALMQREGLIERGRPPQRGGTNSGG